MIKLNNALLGANLDTILITENVHNVHLLAKDAIIMKFAIAVILELILILLQLALPHAKMVSMPILCY